MHDVVIRGGRVFGFDCTFANTEVAIDGGTIVALGSSLGEAHRVIDASGRVVLPGAVDPHVHFGNTMPFAEELAIDSGAALLGGITTVGCFLRSTEPYSGRLDEIVHDVNARSRVDVMFHLQVFNDAQIDDLAVCAERFGLSSFKFYLSGIPGIVDSVDEATLLRGMRAARAAALDAAIVAVHCENDSLIGYARATEPGIDRLAQGETSLEAWEHRHPALAEAVAIDTAAELAREAGVRLYVVHVSSANGLERVRAWRDGGVDIVGETTSAYLTIQTDDPNGLLAKQVPPVRSGHHRRALWEGVRDGTIATIGTDNTARSLASKNPDGGLDHSKPGLPMLGVHVPALLETALREQNLSLEQLWPLVSRQPAEVFGVYPRKGVIAPGSDADIVVVDLDLERVVKPKELGSFADFSPLQGRRLRGWPVMTIKGGKVVAEKGRLVAGAPSGKYLPRSSAPVR